MDTATQTITLYIRLMNEGTEVVRPTQAVVLPGRTFRLLPTDSYDPEAEVWEFPPESLVAAELQCRLSGEILVAVPLKAEMADLATTGAEVANLSRDQRSKFLLNLANELTVTARGTYSPACDEVSAPEDLRRYNEIMHRILANLRETLYGPNEDLWAWDLIAEETLRLPQIVPACRRALELTNKGRGTPTDDR